MKAYRGPKGEIRLFRPDMNMARMNVSMSRLFLPVSARVWQRVAPRRFQVWPCFFLSCRVWICVSPFGHAFRSRCVFVCLCVCACVRVCYRARQTFDPEEMLKSIAELVKLDRRWVPEGDGNSLYIRPTGISTEVRKQASLLLSFPPSLPSFPVMCMYALRSVPLASHELRLFHLLQATLGVGASSSAEVFTLLSPVGPYYPEGFKPVSLYATSKYTRAWEGGTGNTKIGAYVLCRVVLCCVVLCRDLSTSLSVCENSCC